MGIGEEPSQLSQEVSQQEVPEVLRMEPSSPGLVSAHMSSSNSMIIGATSVGCPKTAREPPWTEHLKLIWQSSGDTQQAPSWPGTAINQLAEMESPLDFQDVHFIGQHLRLKLGNMGSRRHRTPAVISLP